MDVPETGILIDEARDPSARTRSSHPHQPNHRLGTQANAPPHPLLPFSPSDTGSGARVEAAQHTVVSEAAGEPGARSRVRYSKARVLGPCRTAPNRRGPTA